jgi:hypothetical protein
MKYAVEMGCHQTHTKFHKYWFRHSKADRGFTDSMMISYAYFYFFKRRKVG